MDYSFIKTEAEGYALYLSALCYLAAIVIVLTRYLKIVRNKKLDDRTRRLKKRNGRVLALISMFICSLIHVMLFLIFFESFPDKLNPDATPRTSYYFSILLTMLVFSFFMWFGMFLKGTSTLPKHEGPVTGV